jgi:hypothetical protein
MHAVVKKTRQSQTSQVLRLRISKLLEEDILSLLSGISSRLRINVVRTQFRLGGGVPDLPFHPGKRARVK